MYGSSLVYKLFVRRFTKPIAFLSTQTCNCKAVPKFPKLSLDCSAFGSHNVSSDGSYGISNGEIKCSDPDGVNELKANTSWDELYEKGIPGKSILGDYFQENRTSQ